MQKLAIVSGGLVWYGKLGLCVTKECTKMDIMVRWQHDSSVVDA